MRERKAVRTPTQEAGGRSDPLREVAQERFAAACGVTSTMVRKWLEEGMPGRHLRGGRVHFDLDACLPWLRTRWGRDAQVAPGDGTISRQQAEIDLLVQRRVTLALKTAVLGGRYVERHHVEAESVKKINAVRTGLEALVRGLVPTICELCPEAEPEPVASVIREQVRGLLEAFAGETTANRGRGAGRPDAARLPAQQMAGEPARKR